MEQGHPRPNLSSVSQPRSSSCWVRRPPLVRFAFVAQAEYALRGFAHY